MPQTRMVPVILQQLWWWRQLHSWHSITFQHSPTIEPHGFFIVATSQVHPHHTWSPRRRQRRWRFPDCTTRWWPLDYRRNSRKTFMYTWTFSTSFFMSITMPIYGLHIFIVLWHLGSQWHFWIWRFDDHIQWLIYSCPRWWHWVLKSIDYG